MFPPCIIFSVSFRFACFCLCCSASSPTSSLPPLLPSSPFASTQCSLAHILSVCLFPILALISILLSVSWRRIGCSQPGSCVLLVLCHHRGALANPLSICLEELKDALSPGTSGLWVARRGPYRNCTRRKRTHMKADGQSWNHRQEKLIIHHWSSQQSAHSIPHHWPLHVSPEQNWGYTCLVLRQFSRVPLHLLLDCFHFFLLSVLVGERRNDSISSLPRSVHCTLMQFIFYFLQTLLVTVQWGNWFSLQLNHCLYMHMYNTVQHKYDLCKLKWVQKVVARLNVRNESGNQIPNMLWRCCWMGNCFTSSPQLNLDGSFEALQCLFWCFQCMQ